MSLYGMFTVDLNRGVSEDARDIFNEYLRKNNWTKLKLTTTWWAQFTDSSTETSALLIVKKHVRDAASAAGIYNYEVSVMFGPSAPQVWNQAA